MLSDNIKTWELELRMESYKKGFKEGFREGREEAIKNFSMEIFPHILESQFGIIPSWVLEKIYSGTVEENYYWIIKSVCSETLEEIFI